MFRFIIICHSPTPTPSLHVTQSKILRRRSKWQKRFTSFYIKDLHGAVSDVNNTIYDREPVQSAFDFLSICTHWTVKRSGDLRGRTSEQSLMAVPLCPPLASAVCSRPEFLCCPCISVTLWTHKKCLPFHQSVWTVHVQNYSVIKYI